MTSQDIDIFEKLQTQLDGLHGEISALSKKSQNDPLNKFKLKFVNKIIEDSNNLLGEKYVPFKDFIKFDENELPTNSDVAMMLSQYLNCFEKLRSDNIKMSTDRNRFWVWVVDGQPSSIRTVRPNSIKEK